MKKEIKKILDNDEDRRRKILRITLVFMLLFFTSLNIVTADDNSPQKICTKFLTPFHELARNNYQTLVNRCFSEYGDYRSTPVKGHKHAGIDLRGKLSENVYPIGIGQVKSVLWAFPNLALAVFHPLPNHEGIYSLYIHIEGIQVKPGDWVDENTVIARLFNADEFKKSQFTAVHLHLEIRKSLEDEGKASYSSMTIGDLNRYCADPKQFFRQRLE
jgi:murein DD-endopeptidase MepM/ murein hydrolase activator NlpD